jgi:SAM-dependent methyltransferase
MSLISSLQTALKLDERSARREAWHFFLVGFLVLFLELACIRWMAAYVVFLQFFTNVVLLASFLGMSCGCLAARRRRDWLGHFPFIALAGVAAAIATTGIYHYWDGLVFDVGSQTSPQEVFFGTEYRNADVGQFVVPIELVAGAFFLVVAFMFVGLGQVLGRTFDGCSHRLAGYAWNIGGSLAGIMAFSALSFAQAPPGWWFLIACCGIAYFLHQAQRLTAMRGLALVALVIGTGVPIDWLYPHQESRWSPYYEVVRDKEQGKVTVNAIAHQQMFSFDGHGPVYSLIHLLRQHSGGEPFHDALIIGAGTGNDVSHALRFGVDRIDAVEIDPVIHDIGVHYHPDHPYQDSRVVSHLDDGRHFLRTTDRKFDLVVYALVDSLILHSSYANIRLESYLFTQEAFADVQRVLKPGGVFVMYNFFRQGWIVERVASMAQKAFGCAPLVLSLPYRETLSSTSLAGLTIIVAGCDQRIPAAFREHGTFWLDNAAPRNLDFDGFAVDPEKVAPERRADYLRIAPTRVVHEGDDVVDSSDSWPFLYLRGRLIPDLTIRSIVLLGGLGIAMVYFFMPQRRIAVHNRMFFLGAAFMLLETKAVVQMALLFGSTWLVNSLVFATALLLILLANVYVLKVPNIRLSRHYAALLLVLLAGIALPLDAFLGGDVVWRYGAPSLLTLGPMFFAGVIFARTFREAPDADQAFGSNIAGSVLGGLSESASMLLGFRYLPLLAIAFYLLSAWPARSRRAP